MQLRSKNKYKKKKEFVWCNVKNTLCYGLPCVFFITRHVCKLDYTLGYNLKGRELKKNKDCVHACKIVHVLYIFIIFSSFLEQENT